MLERARAITQQIITWRRHIHQHPELSFQEVETARFVAQSLAGMGLTVQAGVGKTGVIGRLGSGSPVIALRADMDALPICEETGLPFASQNPGVMHACGHDAHVACLLGAARLLADMPPTQGQVVFLFQPSEETVDDQQMSGAMLMVQDGAMEGVQAVIGMHIWPDVPCGCVALSAGPQMASAGKFEARIIGRGGHGASPHRTIDPIVLSAQAILALQTIISRRLDPLESGVVTIGAIHGGTRDNVIPDMVELMGTLRALSDSVYEQIKGEIAQTLRVVELLGGHVEVEFSGAYPVVSNDAQLTDFVRQIAIHIVGAEAVLPARPVMGGEDFSILAQHAPGCYVRLGGQFPGQPARNGHSATFDIDENALPLGAALLAQTALRYLDGSELLRL